MGEAFIVRKGGVSSETTAAPTITIVSETGSGVTFTLTNNDDNTALITHEVDDQIGGVELAAAATSSNITVTLAAGTYTLSAFATVVGEVATSATVSVVISIPEYEELFKLDVTNAVTQIDITGLSIGKADTLRLVYTTKGDSTVIGNVSLFPNNEDTITNYFHQRLDGNGASITASRVQSNFLCIHRSTILVSGFADIKISNNDKFVYCSQKINRIGSASNEISQTNINNVSVINVSAITKLSIKSDRTNGLVTGTRFQLYKVTEAA